MDHDDEEVISTSTRWHRLQPVWVALFLTPFLHAAAVSADSTRGAQVFELQGCAQCHALNGVGPGVSDKPGPDLGRVADRGIHAGRARRHQCVEPCLGHVGGNEVMRSVPRPSMDEQQAADLFAFFYSFPALF